MSAPITLTEGNFDSVVLDSTKPVIVDFWAEWCGPCKKLGPIIDEVADELGDDITVGKVDVDSQRGLGAKYQIMSIPTVLIFKDGKKVGEFVGVRPKASIIREIKKHL